MARIPVLTANRMYEAEQKGDTLIVTCRGEPMGFSATEAEAELQAVQSFFKKEQLNGMIVNLGGTGYVGTQMVGSLSKLAETVQRADGKFAICEPSRGTREIFKALGLDNQWYVFDTEAIAVRAIVTERFGQKLQFFSQPKFYLSVFSIVVVGVIGWWIWHSQTPAARVRRAISRLESIWNRYEVILKYEKSADSWKDFQAEALPVLKSTSNDLEQQRNHLAGIRFKIKQLIDTAMIPVIKRSRERISDSSKFVRDCHRRIRNELPTFRTELQAAMEQTSRETARTQLPDGSESND